MAEKEMSKQDEDDVWGHWHNCFVCKFSYLELDKRLYYCSLKGELIGGNYELYRKNDCNMMGGLTALV